MSDDNINLPYPDALKEFQELFDSLDILDQIWFVFYHDSNISISREQAANVLVSYLLHRSFKFFRDAFLRANVEGGDSDDE